MNTKKDKKLNVSLEDELFFTHQYDDREKNLGYNERDWFHLGWSEGMKQKSEYGYKNNFSKNLKIIRTALGYTMEELHIQCGVAMQTIGKYEAGDTEPTVSNLIKIAKALDVSIAYLVGADLKLEIKEL